jgi:hypothetical protein
MNREDQFIFLHQTEVKKVIGAAPRLTDRQTVRPPLITKFPQENPTDHSSQLQPINCNTHEKSLTSSMSLIREGCVGVRHVPFCALGVEFCGCAAVIGTAGAGPMQFQPKLYFQAVEIGDHFNSRGGRWTCQNEIPALRAGIGANSGKE